MAERKSMRLARPPVITRSELSGRVYLTTEYQILDAEKGLIAADVKVDITQELERFLEREKGARDV